MKRSWPVDEQADVVLWNHAAESMLDISHKQFWAESLKQHSIRKRLSELSGARPGNQS
jgi:hypothetical protein